MSIANGYGEIMKFISTPLQTGVLNKTHYDRLYNVFWEGDNVNSGGMSGMGCDFVRQPVKMEDISSMPKIGYFDIDLCDVNAVLLFGMRSARSFCPVACGCTTRIVDKYTF